MLLLILYAFIFPLPETLNPPVARSLGSGWWFGTGDAGSVVIKTGRITSGQYHHALGHADSQPHT